MQIKLTNCKEYTEVDPIDYEKHHVFNWHKNGDGYAIRKSNKKCKFLHREILAPNKGLFTDHINGNKLDNRRCNLRVATAQQNAFNQRGVNGKTKGVTWVAKRRKWQAQAKLNYKTYWLGYFSELDDALLAYDNFAKKHYGRYAKTNGGRA